MTIKALRRALLAALWCSALGCGACERAPAPAAPPAVLSAAPGASASVSAPAPAPGELVVVAEGAPSLGAFSLENALVLTHPLRADKGSWDVVYRGQLLSAPDPGLVDPEQSTANDRWSGLWPDGVSLIHVWLDTWTRQDNFLGSAAYALRGGKWHKLGQEDDGLYLDVWESPRGCWLGLPAQSWFDRHADSFAREALECPAAAPPRWSVPSGPGTLLTARGLPDGGVVGARKRAPAESFFDAHHPEALPELVIWDRAGASRALRLPAPPAAPTSEWHLLSPRIVREAGGALVFLVNLVSTASPEPNRVSLVYAARCEASSCAPLVLPPLVSVEQAEATEDGALLLTGEEKNEPSWTLWARPREGAWRRIGRPPARLGKTIPKALYSSSAEDVWVAAESPESPAPSALLRSR